jgi:hypothetical protein
VIFETTDTNPTNIQMEPFNANEQIALNNATAKRTTKFGLEAVNILNANSFPRPLTPEESQLVAAHCNPTSGLWQDPCNEVLRARLEKARSPFAKLIMKYRSNQEKIAKNLEFISNNEIPTHIKKAIKVDEAMKDDLVAEIASMHRQMLFKELVNATTKCVETETELDKFIQDLYDGMRGFLIKKQSTLSNISDDEIAPFMPKLPLLFRTTVMYYEWLNVDVMALTDKMCNNLVEVASKAAAKKLSFDAAKLKKAEAIQKLEMPASLGDVQAMLKKLNTVKVKPKPKPPKKPDTAPKKTPVTSKNVAPAGKKATPAPAKSSASKKPLKSAPKPASSAATSAKKQNAGKTAKAASSGGKKK